jgi:hypothetical protein
MTWQARPSAAPRLTIAALALGLLAAGAHHAAAADLPRVRYECVDLGTVRHPDGTAVSGRQCGPRVDDLLRRQLVIERRRHAAERARLVRVVKADPQVSGVPRSHLSTVAFCESGHRPWARNGRYRGLFQMGPMFASTPYGRAGLSPYDPYVAALATAQVVRVQGWRQWACRPDGSVAY